ncbi:MAG TPA: adenylosuccinate lyase [Bdellovibrionales bacterium]|nr:adenylosuccinate lyase [Pseudobdellovibrionaceae bacterium]HAG90342.1 adenylosuccinate lyase [Bdellovibrionales bacterium]
MISRYTRPEMGELWSAEARFQCLLEVEVAVAQAQSELGIIPKKAAADIQKKSKFSVDRIAEIEKTTRHDVIAFVSNLAENVGPMGRYIHYGMTSSDVLDTALAVQLGKAEPVLKESYLKLEKALLQKVEEHKETLCAGRTHGMHAEATTFGLKMGGYLAELKRSFQRFERAMDQAQVGKLSGAVGTYSTQSPEVEKKVCEKLGLKVETIATQVIPRDRHAEVLWSLAMLGAALERLSVELRHLQRTEVGEVTEGFQKGQKGSSAMPHKKNPISAENLTGVARLLRGYLSAGMEDIALWHERDISHSSVERVAFPDAFILCDYALDRMARVIEGLYVDTDRMKKNIELSQGHLFSSQALLALIEEQGVSREEAYAEIQGICHGMKPGESLKILLLEKGKIKSKTLDQIFSGKTLTVGVKENLKRLKKQLALKS